MRILHWTESFWPFIGGVEVLLDRLVEFQTGEGHTVIVVTKQTNDALPSVQPHGKATIHRFRAAEAMLSNDLKQIKVIVDQIADLKRAFKPDLVHIHLCEAFPWFHLLTREAHPAATLVTVHTSTDMLGPVGISAMRRSMVSRVLASADWIAAICESQKRDLIAFDSALEAKTSVIFNGLPLSKTLPLPVSVSPFSMLCIGRMAPEKGFDVAIRAFARVVKDAPEVRLVLAGDGPERARLHALVAEMGLERSVTFTGWVLPDHVASAISSSTVLVVPSVSREPFGLVALEGAQMGRPVIASRTGGLAEIVSDHETGLLVPPGDPELLAEAILSLVRNPQRVIQMSQCSRQRAETFFPFKKCAEGYEKLYQQLRIR